MRPRRPIKVSAKEAARLEALFGAQGVRIDVPLSIQAAETKEADPKRRKYALNRDPEVFGKPDPPGFAAVHHLGVPVPCRRCKHESKLLVQTGGLTGPISLGEPVCETCGNEERRLGRPPRKRKPLAG